MIKCLHFTFTTALLFASFLASEAKLNSAGDAFVGDGTTYGLDDPSNGNCNFMSYPAAAKKKYAALNTPQFKSTMNCGRCARVKCIDDRCSSSKSETVYIVDQCPGCAHGDLDLSPDVFEKVTGSGPSRLTIEWTFVDCPEEDSNIEYCLKGGSNEFWTAIQPTNFIAGVKNMEINGESGSMVPSAYYFLKDGLSQEKTDLSNVKIKLEGVNGEKIEDTVSFEKESCVKGSRQFARGSAMTRADLDYEGDDDYSDNTSEATPTSPTAELEQETEAPEPQPAETPAPSTTSPPEPSPTPSPEKDESSFTSHETKSPAPESPEDGKSQKSYSFNRETDASSGDNGQNDIAEQTTDAPETSALTTSPPETPEPETTSPPEPSPSPSPVPTPTSPATYSASGTDSKSSDETDSMGTEASEDSQEGKLQSSSYSSSASGTWESYSMDDLSSPEEVVEPTTSPTLDSSNNLEAHSSMGSNSASVSSLSGSMESLPLSDPVVEPTTPPVSDSSNDVEVQSTMEASSVFSSSASYSIEDSPNSEPVLVSEPVLPAPTESFSSAASSSLNPVDSSSYSSASVDMSASSASASASSSTKQQLRTRHDMMPPVQVPEPSDSSDSSPPEANEVSTKDSDESSPASTTVIVAVVLAGVALVAAAVIVVLAKKKQALQRRYAKETFIGTDLVADGESPRVYNGPVQSPAASNYDRVLSPVPSSKV